MLIDAFDECWLDRLNEPADGVHYLLIDGAFVPGLHRRMSSSGMELSLIFESLPACSAAARDVSPFLVTWKVVNRRFEKLLGECSGWPMVSVISSIEGLAELTARLAAWCVVEADGQRFNFRFPDTRRLPAIFDALLPEQRKQFIGPATRWSFVGRNGLWRELEMSGGQSPIAENPSLDSEQFARLVVDSEPDEVLAMLAYRGISSSAARSQCHAAVSSALRVAAKSGVDLNALDKLAWCEACLEHGFSSDQTEAIRIFNDWKEARFLDVVSNVNEEER